MMKSRKSDQAKAYPLIGEDPPKDPDPGEMKVIVKKDDKGRPYYETPEGDRLFTQTHMNTEIGAARQKEGEKNKQLIGQLQELQEKASTSEAMKAELQQQIEQLQSANLSKEEQLANQIKLLQTDLNKTKESMSVERDTAVSRWQEECIKNQLQSAAIDNNAISFEQIYGLLRGRTQLKPVFNEAGKPTDQHEVLVSLEVPDADGNVVQKELQPKEALKVMREDLKDRYHNLFHSADRPGMGGGTQSSSSLKSDTPPPEALKDYESYKTWAAQNMKGSSV